MKYLECLEGCGFAFKETTIDKHEGACPECGGTDFREVTKAEYDDINEGC